MWGRLGRQDILAWVRTETLRDGSLRHRIWIHPETGRAAETCPFLARPPGSAACVCRIQEVKPAVCREYPLTLKHARMTDCPAVYEESL